MTEASTPRRYPRPGVEVRAIEQLASLADRRVLELGCGDGRLTFQYASRVRDVLALDPDSAVMKHALAESRRRGLENVEFITGSAASPPRRRGRFDVVLFSTSL